jgi:predicted nucleotidyltransferase
MPSAIRETLESFRAALERDLPGRLERLLLFGSWARGEATEDSDVDVFVLLTEATAAERARSIDLGSEAAQGHGIVIAPLVMTRAEWDELVRRERLLPREILRDGVEL